MTIDTDDLTYENYKKYKKVYQIVTMEGVWYFDDIESIKKAGFKVLEINKGEITGDIKINHLWKEGTPTLEGLIGGMFNGSANEDYMKYNYPERWKNMDNTIVIRYEDSKVYEMLSR